MTKSRDAFRTISEVSATIDTPAHVLRFWETKFSQVKPVKRAGGRRYYRPGDVVLLAGIKQLLHTDGMSIKDTQKLLRAKGVKHVAALGSKVIASLAENDNEDKQKADPAAVEAPVETTERPENPTAPLPTPELSETTEHEQDTAHTATTDDIESTEETEKVETPQANPVETDELAVDRPIAASEILDVVPAETLEAENRGESVEAVETTEKTPETAPSPATPHKEPFINTPAPTFNFEADTVPDIIEPVINVRADPSDNDSVASARVFHLLLKASEEKLAGRADTIAPLLKRLRVLRDRVAAA